MKVRIVSQPAGLVSFDGKGLVPWPAVGDEVNVPDVVGADLCASGAAEPVAEKKRVETRAAKKTAAKKG